jgi:hypothetical protein|uniref:Uncharacterized protein n=1 Tax=Eutreptiella gymnastica TaxID=73025 RepID=A0A7S4GBS6_9EUGL
MLLQCVHTAAGIRYREVVSRNHDIERIGGKDGAVMLGGSPASAPEVGGAQGALREIRLQAGGQSVMSVLYKLNTPTFPRQPGSKLMQHTKGVSGQSALTVQGQQ